MHRRVVLAGLMLMLTVMAMPGTAQVPAGEPPAVPVEALLTEDRPDAQAPAGVPRGHVLEAGQVSMGLRYDYARFGHLRDGTTEVAPEAAWGLGYTLAPTAFNAHRYTAEAMYAPSRMVTLFAELPLVHHSMLLERETGPAVDLSETGIGDLRIGAMLRALEREGTRGHVTLGLSLPTGSTQEWDEPGPYPYAAHLGSGTFDITPGAVVVHQTPLWSWGGHMAGTVRVGEGTDGFALGNGVELSGWAARRLLHWATGSLRLAGHFWGDVRDDVPTFPASPASEPGLTGGNRIELVAGVNFQAAAGIFVGHRLFGELGFPIYQDLDGPQLGQSWRATVGWRWMLGQGLGGAGPARVQRVSGR